MTTALPRPLLERVPMPNTSDPLAVAAAGRQDRGQLDDHAVVIGVKPAHRIRDLRGVGNEVSTQPPTQLELQAK